MDYTKLFEAKPIADVANPLELLAKFVISKKKLQNYAMMETI